MPTYGYVRRDECYGRSVGGNLTNEWAIRALRGMIYTDRKGRNAGADTSICQIPWEGGKRGGYLPVDGT